MAHPTASFTGLACGRRLISRSSFEAVGQACACHDCNKLKEKSMNSWQTQTLLLGCLLGFAGPLRGGDAPCSPCATACCCAPAPCDKCVVLPDVVIRTRNLYACKEATICLPHRLLGGLFPKPCCNAGCCQKTGCCDCPPASPPTCCVRRTRHVLLKKVLTTECPSFKCEAVCCPTQGCAHRHVDEQPPMVDEPQPREKAPKKTIPKVPSAHVPEAGIRAAHEAHADEFDPAH
jgi:hypothetical protein